jgi:uncharacterized membrane protein YhaH (DUF805 family)
MSARPETMAIWPAVTSSRRTAAPSAKTLIVVTLPSRSPRNPGRFGSVKKILELLVCFLHPVAVILVWIDLATRRNIGFVAKVAWAVCALIPFVPFLYVLTGGDLW